MKMSYGDRRLRVSRGALPGPTSAVVPRDLTNARVHMRRNAGIVNSLYVCHDRLSNVIVDRYEAVVASLWTTSTELVVHTSEQAGEHASPKL